MSADSRRVPTAEQSGLARGAGALSRLPKVDRIEPRANR